jgi:hypothetical protein
MFSEPDTLRWSGTEASKAAVLNLRGSVGSVQGSVNLAGGKIRNLFSHILALNRTMKVGNKVIYDFKLKQSLRFPGGWGSKISWQRHRVVVSLSALRTGRIYSQEIHLVLISVRGWVDPQGRSAARRIKLIKKKCHPRESNPRPFRLVTQCLNQLRHRITQLQFSKTVC